MDCDVIPGPNEENEMLPSVDRTEENFEQKIENLSADKAFGTGANLEGMETRNVNFHTPVESPAPQEGNPAKREDPRQPVPEAEWAQLPRNDKEKLDKSCFVYDAEADCYYCPLGRVLDYEQIKREQGRETRHVYRCGNCEGCPLAGICRDANSPRGRSISRDEREPLRERMHTKMQTEAARTIYNRRMHIGETPFAIIKNIFEVRRFLLRGLEKVRTEWCWVCMAYNLKKLMAAMVALRAQDEKMTVIVKG